MFESATFESSGTIRTSSRNWMIATSGLNGSVLFALVLIPLLCPHSLPPLLIPYLMQPPVMPTIEPKPIARVQTTAPVAAEMQGNHIFAPRTIPRLPYIADAPETVLNNTVATMPMDESASAAANLFSNHNSHPVVRQPASGPVRISGLVVEGLLVQKTIPRYPPIAVASRTQGTVVLQATISRSGTIENLRVIGGPIMLHQAAMDAVKNWRYRPYLLSGEPVEVETTVNVVFKLQN